MFVYFWCLSDRISEERKSIPVDWIQYLRLPRYLYRGGMQPQPDAISVVHRVSASDEGSCSSCISFLTTPSLTLPEAGPLLQTSRR